MDRIEFKIEEFCSQCELLDNYCDLQLRKDEIQPALAELKIRAEKAKSLLEESKELCEKKLPQLKNQFEEALQKMKDQNMIVLQTIIEIKKIKEKNKTYLKPKALPMPVTPLQVKHLKNENTPKLYSPIVRHTPVSIQPHAISPEAFDSIPKYMRGRETVGELQQFLDNILTGAFIEKYQLLNKERECLRGIELMIWRSYKAETSVFCNKIFINQEDLRKKLNKSKIDRNSQTKLHMLRHLGIIQIEQRSQTVYYIWMGN